MLLYMYILPQLRGECVFPNFTAIITNFQIKGTAHPKIKTIFFFLPVVLFISLDSFGVSCLVLEISAIEIYPSIHLIEILNTSTCLAPGPTSAKCEEARGQLCIQFDKLTQWCKICMRRQNEGNLSANSVLTHM